MIAKNEKPRWSFYLGWVVLNFIAIVIAWYIAWALISQITKIVGDTIRVGGQSHITEDSMFLYVFFPIIGLLTGILQYILLRRYLPHMTWWIVATFCGWLMPFITGFFLMTVFGQLNDTFFIMLGLLLIGATIAVPQWWLLRQRVRYAFWWILAYGFGWGMTGLLNLVTSETWPILLALALMPAIATGIACWLLLDWLPKHELIGLLPTGGDLSKYISSHPDQLPVETSDPNTEHRSAIRTPVKVGFFIGQAIILLSLPFEIRIAVIKLPSFVEAQASEGLMVSLCAYIPFVILCEIVAWIAFVKKQPLRMIVATVPPLLALAGLAYLAIYSLPPTSTLIATSTPTVADKPISPPKKMLLLYDDDGSRDGTAALLYLLSYPDISIQAITISYGEAHPKLYVQHIGRVLDIFGISDIPLGAGQDMPLAGGTPFPDFLRQLSDNFWNYPLPNTDKTYPFQNAPELMVSIINQASEPVTIFLSGPFTNLAQALHLDPAIKDNISAVYFMGGAVYVRGNITGLIPDSNNRVADWNIITDPQAAKEVFESGLALYMVPLDATNKVMLRREDILPWRQGDEKANMVAELYDLMFSYFGMKTVEIFDLTAAVIMVQSEACNFQPLHLDVITDNGPTLGQTIVVPNTEPNIHVCLEPKADQVKRNLNEIFSP